VRALLAVSTLLLASGFLGAGTPPPQPKAKHWAFQPVERPAVPLVKNTAWVRNPIDAFIAARHEAKGLTPAPEAEKRKLIRRLSLDLIGLPPTLAEIEAFVNDPAPDAYERLVERLLQSPHYGEHWARFWLDLARWAESEGYESNHLRPYAWRYRDYVVKSFNADTPYSLFLRQQLAGDEMLPYSDDNLIATGFLTGCRLSTNEEDQARQRNDMLVDVVNATGSALLGLTLNCAQCHNHRFDPITIHDYYRFQGFFVKGQPGNLALRDPQLWAAYNAHKPAEYDPAVQLRDRLFAKAREALLAKARAKLSPAMLAALAVPAAQRTAEQHKLAHEADLMLQIAIGATENAIPAEDRKLYEELKKKIAAMEKMMLDRPQTFGFYSPATSPTPVDVLPMKGFYPLPYRPEELARARSFVLLQGDVHRRADAVDPGWPEVFGPTPPAAVAKTPRLALANWLTSGKHPLTARVWVNRLWQQHFGRGLVATPSDFGTKGAMPTHPELLDWLADELVRGGWSTKHLHRLIVTSSTYRQAAKHNDTNAKIDPDNRLWWRWQPRRLDAEALRDTLLAVSGELDRHVGGPSDPADNKSLRRALYILHGRGSADPFLKAFDGPDAVLESCPARPTTTTPVAALFLLNNPFAEARTRALAARMLQAGGKDLKTIAQAGFDLALGRPVAEKEWAAVKRHLEEHPEAAPPEEFAALMAWVLLNSNELLYLD
jgi:hypothetical protein